jgi:acyl-CoA thioester hydrolase
VRYGDTVTVRASISEVREKIFRVDHEVSVGERHCASGFEVRAWVGQPDEPGGELHAKPLPIEIVTKLKGEGGVYA